MYTHVRTAHESWCEQDGSILAGIAAMNLGIARKILGDVDRAITQFQRARSYFEVGGDLARLAEVHHLMGMSFLTKQLSPEAMNEFEHSLSLAGNSREKRGLAFLGKAYAFYYMGDSKTALSLVDRCLAGLSVLPNRMYLAELFRLKEMIYVQRGNTREAERAFQKRQSLAVGESYFNRTNKEKSTDELRRPR